MILTATRLLKNTKISGITLFPFIIIKNAGDAANPVLMNHERIHLRQQAEMLVLPFYIWYVAEYYWRLARSGDRHLAYRSISFEREAYENEANPAYLGDRRFWAFLKYLRRP